MSLLPYALARPFLFGLDPEHAHELTLGALARLQNTPLQCAWAQPRVHDPVRLAGLTFPNRIGLAAGLDKNGRCIDGLAAIGFGSIEVGTVTPKPQAGNPRPRMFRLPEAGALINRLGFNNEGVDAFVANVGRARFRQQGGILGLNIGKNATTPIERAVDDYLLCLDRVYPHADYVTLNISSPNTQNLRSLQRDDALDAMLTAVRARTTDLAKQHGRAVPIFVKIAPDLDPTQVDAIAAILKRHAIDGVIATNTTLARDAVQGLPHGSETGGLSGTPVFAASNRVITQLRAALGPAFPIIGVGGVMSADDARAKIAAGADLVQVYTGFIYGGPPLIAAAARALASDDDTVKQGATRGMTEEKDTGMTPPASGLPHGLARRCMRRSASWLRRTVALGAIALLGACSALPRITPDMAVPRGAPQLVGAHGPLSAERSREILDRLRADGHQSDVLERHLALEQAFSDSPLTAGNKVGLLLDGPATYRAMFAAIETARDHINMETYILEDDEVGERFASALIAKQAQGVQVNLIRDSVGTLGTSADFFKRLTDAGIQVLEFNPVNPLNAVAGWDVNQRDHRKLLIVDGRIAFLGGINISSVYSGSSFGIGSRPRGDGKQPWRDTDLQIEGPVVAEYQKLFIETWQKQKGAPLAERDYYPAPSRVGNEIVHAIGSSPDEPFSVMYATLISAIDAAESEILLTNAYFVPDPQLVAALKTAVARGVTVKLILPSQTDSGLVFHAGRASYDELLQDGIQIHLRQNALLHAKTALIDGVWATVGSTNLDWRSFLHNQEINAVVLGTDFGDRLRQSFDADLARSERLTLETWRQRPLGDRLKESFARMWQYWL